MMVMINVLNGKEETWVLQEKEVDKAWIIQDDGSQVKSPEESYGGNGFRRATWIENIISNQNNEDLD